MTRVKLTEDQKKLAVAMSRLISPENKLKNIERQKMAQELFKYSKDIIEEFDENFYPPQMEYYKPSSENGGYGTYNYYTQNVIDKNGDYANVTLLIENSFDDFWKRWNRFKNLKAFL